MLNYNLPINNTSFGQISWGMLRYLYEKGENPNVFPKGENHDISSQQFDPSFNQWLQGCISKGYFELDRVNQKTFSIWHLYDSFTHYTNKDYMLSFYELDSPTPLEMNAIRNTTKTFFSSEYTVNLFKEYGVDNVEYLPLFFDKWNFHQKTDKQYFSDDRIVFNVVGKFEIRKNHPKILKAWAKKYGRKTGDGKGPFKYFLQCAVSNRWLGDEQTNNAINQVFEGEKYDNINFFGHMSENLTYNDFLNSANIVIGMSGGEGWGLPEFQSVAMGKHSVMMNAHSYKSWANSENSVLVNPHGKFDSHDGAFFYKGDVKNQGKFFDFKEDDFIDGCEEAIKRVESNPVNEVGLSLQNTYSVDKFFENLERLTQ